MKNITIYQPWTFAQKIIFRFFFCFFIFYIFPFPLNNIPFATEINKISEKILSWYTYLLDYVTIFWHWLIPGIGKKILQLKTPITIFTNGSGDTTYDYVLLLTQFVSAIFFSAVWGFIDRKRSNYIMANYWLCVLLRYFLASMMLSYGFIKVFHLQMPSPNLYRLVQPYGDSSPMGLAWTYVGQSKGFSALVGWSEVLCGVLLLFRKTILIGALFSLIVMGNVVAINFCYDVPVKILSSFLEIVALYLSGPYLKKIFQFFIMQKVVGISYFYQPHFTNKQRLLKIFLKCLFIADALFYGIKGSIDNTKKYGDYAPKPPLHGIYNTEVFIRNNDTIAPLTTDTTRWRQIIVQTKEYARIKLMNDTFRTYVFKVDTTLKKITLYPRLDSSHKYTLNYYSDTAHLTLSGRIKNDSFFIRAKRYDERQFRLINRGFHWINEYPYNR